MAFRLPRWQRSIAIVDPKTGYPTVEGQRWQQSFAEKIETQETSQDDLIAQLQAVQADILAAQADIIAAQADADAAAIAAAAAQAAADAAQATADAIVVPPSGSRTVSADTTLVSDDFSVLVDATAGPVTITLFAAAVAMNTLSVQKIDASANAVSVVPGGADDLNGGGAAIVLAAQYDKLNLTSDGITDWFA
jgi:hypothetical protein